MEPLVLGGLCAYAKANNSTSTSMARLIAFAAGTPVMAQGTLGHGRSTLTAWLKPPSCRRHTHAHMARMLRAACARKRRRGRAAGAEATVRAATLPRAHA